MEREYWEDKNKSGEDLICLLVDHFETPLLRSEFQKANVFGKCKHFKIHAKTHSKYAHKKNMGINHKFA